MATTVKIITSLLLRRHAIKNGGLLSTLDSWNVICRCCSTSSLLPKEKIHVAGSNNGGINTLGVTPECFQEYFCQSESFVKSKEWTSNLVSGMIVHPNFISIEEETEIMTEIEPYLSRLHYESSHWDDAIHNYRETERGKWNAKNTKVIDRIRSLCFPTGVSQLRFVHILDLQKSGVIKPHIDSVRFCGNTIAGVSLLSDSIMRLRHDIQKDLYCDILLPRLSLYIMRDIMRYEFTHEILGEKESLFKEKFIPRNRRISIICRNEPDVSKTEGPEFKAIDP